MYGQAMAEGAYNATKRTVRSNRETEYELIAQITHELKHASQQKNSNFPLFAAAIHKNNQLWSTLASNVAESTNQLPSSLRAQIFYLSEFSHRHAAQALAGKSGVAPLLEINTAILRGLRQSAEV